MLRLVDTVPKGRLADFFVKLAADVQHKDIQTIQQQIQEYSLASAIRVTFHELGNLREYAAFRRCASASTGVASDIAEARVLQEKFRRRDRQVRRVMHFYNIWDV